MPDPIVMYFEVDANDVWTGRAESEAHVGWIGMTETQLNALLAAQSGHKKFTINADGAFAVNEAATLVATRSAKKRELDAAKAEHADKQVYANIGNLVEGTDLLKDAFIKLSEAVTLHKGATEPADSGGAEANTKPTHAQVTTKLTEANNKKDEAVAKLNEAKPYQTLNANHATLLAQIEAATTTAALAAITIPDDLSAALPQSGGNEGA